MATLELFGKDGVGKVALIDDEDYEKCSKYKWFVNQNGYAYAKPDKKYIVLHRLVMDFPDGIVDHINHDLLDNRKSSLRIVTHMENTWNRQVSRRSSSGYRGVYLIESINKYQADIMVDGKRIRLGHFYDPVDAAKARDVAALKYYGEYACLNIKDFDYTDYVPKPDMKEITSQYSGIDFNSNTNKWKARIQYDNKRVLVGEFFTELDAVYARDMRIIRDNIPIDLAFPKETYINMEPPKTRKQPKKTSYIGVNKNKSGKKYESRIMVNKKLIHIGTFDTELLAALAYDKYIIDNKLDRKLNFPQPDTQ